MQTRSVPLQVPFSVHLLTVEPFASNTSLQENLHTVPYIISVVLQLNSLLLAGNGNVGHVTAKWAKKKSILCVTFISGLCQKQISKTPVNYSFAQTSTY